MDLDLLLDQSAQRVDLTRDGLTELLRVPVQNYIGSNAEIELRAGMIPIRSADGLPAPSSPV